MNKKLLSCYFPPNMIEDLNELKKITGSSVSELIRRAVFEYLKVHLPKRNDIINEFKETKETCLDC